MTTYDRLSNAPIKEALIDLQATLPDGFDIAAAKDQFTSKFASFGYSKAKDIRQFEIHGGIDGRQQFFSGAVNSLVGYRFDNDEGTKVIQVRSNGFTFSHLRPYAKWEGFQTETKQFWQVYDEIAKVKDVRRVATRFINVLQCPVEATNTLQDLKAVFSTPPALPGNITGSLQHCLSRIVLFDEASALTSIVTSAVEKPDDSAPQVVLDIDVFQEFKDGISSNDIWALLPKLRDRKNEIFFSCLTESFVGEMR